MKQSAARQCWAVADAKPSAWSFDIASRTGRWKNEVNWIAQPGRSAQIYVFAHHPVADATADHRDPAQWRFYVVATHRLPPTKRLSLIRVSGLAQACTYQELRETVASLADGAC